VSNDDFDYIIEKCKNKKDGVYTARGIFYACKDNKLVLISERDKISQISFGFLVSLGKVKEYQGKEELKRLLKQL
jgi:hypothetical protein